MCGYGSADCGGRAGRVKRPASYARGRKGRERPVLCLQVVDFRHSRSGHLVKLARRFSAERPTKRDKPTRINRYCVLQLNKAIRVSSALKPAAVGPSDHNNDRYSWWPVCCGNAIVAQLTLDWDLDYSLISYRDTLSAASLRLLMSPFIFYALYAISF